MRSTARGLDWPLEYEQLRPWYDQVQEDVGMSGRCGKGNLAAAGRALPVAAPAGV